MSCSISRIATSCLSVRSSVTTRADSSGPSPAIGSSSSRSRGPVASAIASSSSRCSPWLISDTTMSARAPSPTPASAAPAGPRRARSPPPSRPKKNERPPTGRTGPAPLVERGEIEKERGDLERAREPARAAAIGAQRRDLLPIEADAARVGRDLAGELADQGGLAGTVRADDGVQLAGPDVQRDVVGGDHAAEMLGQALDREKRLTQGGASPEWRRSRRAHRARPAGSAAPG